MYCKLVLLTHAAHTRLTLPVHSRSAWCRYAGRALSVASVFLASKFIETPFKTVFAQHGTRDEMIVSLDLVDLTQVSVLYTVGDKVKVAPLSGGAYGVHHFANFESSQVKTSPKTHTALFDSDMAC